MRSALTGGLFLGLMLLSAVGFYAVRHSLPLQRVLASWLPPSMYKVPQDEAVQARLRNLEALRDARQWNSVMTGVTELQQQFGATLLPDQLALLMALQGARCQRAANARAVRTPVAAATRPDADEVLRLHALLSHESVYFGLSQGYYDAAFEQYAAAHVAQAEQLRLAGRCNEFLAEMQRLFGYRAEQCPGPLARQARVSARHADRCRWRHRSGRPPEATPPAPAAAK